MLKSVRVHPYKPLLRTLSLDTPFHQERQRGRNRAEVSFIFIQMAFGWKKDSGDHSTQEYIESLIFVGQTIYVIGNNGQGLE